MSLAALLAPLQPASIAGIPFYVREDNVDTGRRMTRHTIPNGEYEIEEHGRQIRRYEVTAYVTGPAAAALASAILDLEHVDGPHTLTLPTLTAEVHIEALRRSFAKDELGLIAIDITAFQKSFTTEFGLGSTAIGTLGLLANSLFSALDDLLGAALGALAGGLLGAIGAALGLASGALSFIVDVAATVIDVALTGLALLEIARAVALPGAIAFAVDTALAALPALAPAAEIAFEIARAESLARAAAEAARVEIEALAADVQLAATAPATYFARVATAVVSVARLTAPTEWPRVSADLMAWHPAAPVRAVETPLTRAQADASSAVARVFRVAVVAAAADRAARVNYATRPEALIALGATSSAIEAEIAELSALRPAPVEAMTTMGEIAARFRAAMHAQATALKPIVIVTAPTERPALVAAWDLYQDPSRAEEVATRAGAAHPNYLPTRFEAVAP